VADARPPEDKTPEPAEPPFGDPTRRTYLAQERTLLAWWRTGLAALALAVAVGRVVPGVTHQPTGPYLVVGILFGALGAAFIAYGTHRDRVVQRSLGERGYIPFTGRARLLLTVGLLAVSVAALVVMVTSD
jgi:putative membrane protein